MTVTAPQDRLAAARALAAAFVKAGASPADAADLARVTVNRAVAMRASGDFSPPGEAQRWDAHFHPRVPGGPKGGQFARNPAGSSGKGGVPQFANPMVSGVKPPSVPDTQAKYKRGGKYTAERQILHDKIVAELLAGHHPQEHPTATFFGGGPASGKSSLKAGPDSVPIDADAIKAKLPEYTQMVAAGDPAAAAFVHEESSDISKAVQAAATARRLNFTLDGTGDSSYTKMLGKITAAKAAGYKADGQYVTVDTEEAVRRATKRAKRSGRMVPAAVIRSVHQSVSNVLPALIANNEFDSVKLFDNNGSGPVLVGEKPHGESWVVRDQKAWARFLAKGASGG
jgi:predicted ABC-type ATPase